MENNMQRPADQQREEITVKFAKGLVSEPFMAKTGRECVSIKIPNADPEDKKPWPNIIVAANHVHDNKFGKGMWMKLPADGETRLHQSEITGRSEDGRNTYRNTSVMVPNTQIKAMLESYKTRTADQELHSAAPKIKKSHDMER